MPPHEPAEVALSLKPQVDLNEHPNVISVDLTGRDGANTTGACCPGGVFNRPSPSQAIG
jgi:hypothetical protein